jgi:hypothetical protein
LARLEPTPPVCRALQDLCDWFTEGFDTADLSDARAILAGMTAQGLDDPDARKLDARHRR